MKEENKMNGIVKKLDNLGRLTVPCELRKALRWNPGTPCEMIKDGDTLIIRLSEDCVCERCKTSINKMFNYCPMCGKHQTDHVE